MDLYARTADTDGLSYQQRGVLLHANVAVIVQDFFGCGRRDLRLRGTAQKQRREECAQSNENPDCVHHRFSVLSLLERLPVIVLRNQRALEREIYWSMRNSIDSRINEASRFRSARRASGADFG